VAQNYQEYQFHGLIFEFRPLITDFVTNGAPGVVVMATNYNADVTNYTTKQQMENSEFAVSVKPTTGLMHGIECARAQTVLPKAYIRTGAVPAGQDLRLYDLGNFQMATQANPLQDLGELWVTYCVEFSKPILPVDVGGDMDSAWVYRNITTNTSPLGTQILAPEFTLPQVTITSTAISFFAQPGNSYSINLSWVGASVAWTLPGYTLSGLSYLTLYNNRTSSIAFAPPNGTTTTNGVATTLVKCTLTNPGLVSLSLLGGAIPAGTVDITITGWDSTIV